MPAEVHLCFKRMILTAITIGLLATGLPDPRT
jgi:hypothetical protein